MDDSYDSGISQKPTKQVTSYNKSSTFLTKRKSENEETPLKHPRQDASTSKQESLEIIKRLHIKCGFLDTEHIFMLPINWLSHCEVTDVKVEIVKSLYNAYFTPKSFSFEKYFDNWDPKIHSPHEYLYSFYVDYFINKYGTTKHYTLAIFRNGIPKKMRSSGRDKMDDGIPSSSSDSSMTAEK